MDFEDLVGRLREEDVQISAVHGRLRYDGPQHAMTDDLLATLRAHKQKLLEFAAAHPAIEASGPATAAQQRLVLQSQASSTPEIWNIPLRIDITGEVDVHAMSSALAHVVERHHALRSRLVTRGGRLVQEVLPADGFTLPVEDLRTSASGYDTDSVSAPEAVVEAWCSQLAHAPFDLEAGPALRTCLARTGDAQWVLVIVQHHAITDATSGSVLLREFAELYAAAVTEAPFPLTDTPPQFPDYARWQRDYLDPDRIERHIAFWRQTLTGARFDLPLRGFKPSPDARTGAGASLETIIGPETTAALRELCRTQHVTLYTLLLLGLSRMLSYGTGRDDLVVTGSFGNRHDEAIESMIGLVANTVALRLRSQERLPVAEVLAETGATVAAAMSHQALPFSQVVAGLELGGRPDMAGFPRVWLTLNQQITEGLKLPGAEVTVREIPIPAARSDLGMVAYQTSDSIELHAEYSTETLNEPNVREFLTAYTELLASLPAALYEPWEQWRPNGADHASWCSAERAEVLQ